MTTHKLREFFGYSQFEFAEHFDIPLATVKNWDSRDCMPIYLYRIIEKYEIAIDEIADLKRELGR